MKIVKGLVVNSISGSNRFAHEGTPLIAVTGAVVFGRLPSHHEMPGSNVFFHVAGDPGDGSTVASIGGDFYVSGSTNLLDEVFVPNGTLHIGELPEQMRLFINDTTASIQADQDLRVSGEKVSVDASSGRIQFDSNDEEYLFFDMLPGDNDIRVESVGDLVLQGSEIINNAKSGKVFFQDDGQDRLLVDMNTDPNELTIESVGHLILRGTEIVNDSTEGLIKFQDDGEDRLTFDMSSAPGVFNIESDADLNLLSPNISLQGNVTIGGGEEDEFIINLESTFNEIVYFQKNVFFNDGFNILNDVFYVNQDEAGFNVDVYFNSNVTIGDDPGDALTINSNSTFKNDVLIEGNLTVEGQTTTLNVENLLIKDPFILLASGSTDYNTSGGVVILSGASENPEYEHENDLALGWVDVDTWGVVRIDSKNGTLKDLNGGHLVGFRASEFQVGGDGENLGGKIAYLTDSNTLLVSNPDGVSSLLGKAGSLSSLENGLELTTNQDAAVVDFNVLKEDTAELSNWLRFDMQSNRILPGVDNSIDLGSSQFRFANVYTGDLHLRNDRGHWQIVEEADCLSIYNRLTDVRYKFVLELFD
jgi:hypothetical protein